MAMSYSAELTNKAEKELEKLKQKNKLLSIKIAKFILEKLDNSENPALLPNAKKLSGFKDNRYRWRLGDIRIIGTIKNEIKIIEIIEISKRDDNTYSHTKG